MSVGVVVLLIEAVVVASVDVVHGDVEAFAVGIDAADEIHGSASAGVVDDVEGLEREGERQAVCLVAGGILGEGLTGCKCHTAVLSCPCGESAAEEYDGD